MPAALLAVPMCTINMSALDGHFLDCHRMNQGLLNIILSINDSFLQNTINILVVDA